MHSMAGTSDRLATPDITDANLMISNAGVKEHVRIHIDVVTMINNN